MGTLRRRGNAWELRVHAYGRTHTRTFRGSEAAARKALRLYEVDLRGGGHDTDRTTVAELLDTFMLSRDLSPTTAVEYRRAQATIPAVWARTPIHKMRAPDLDALYRQLGRDGVNVHTVRRIHEVLSAAFAKAVGWGYLDRNPAEHASPPARPRSERTAADVRDVMKLMAAAPFKLRLWLRLAFVTGSRRGELCALKWHDVDLERGVLVVRRNVVKVTGQRPFVKDTKEHTVKVIALDAGTIALLRQHYADEAAYEPSMPERWLFTHDVGGGEPWRPDYVTQATGRLKHELGLTFKLHEIRHATATELLDGGFAMSVVKERLGHDREETTRNFYSHAVKARDREAADYLERLLDG